MDKEKKVQLMELLIDVMNEAIKKPTFENVMLVKVCVNCLENLFLLGKCKKK